MISEERERGMTTLLLLRHGKAESPQGIADIERPLSDEGRGDIRRIGQFLGANGLAPEFVVTSPARRAVESAETCMEAAGARVDRIVRDARIYEASLATLRDVVTDHREQAEHVMLVGHNPGLQALLDDLVVNAKNEPMGTANLAVVDLIFGQLDRLIRPEELPPG